MSMTCEAIVRQYPEGPPSAAQSLHHVAQMCGACRTSHVLGRGPQFASAILPRAIGIAPAIDVAPANGTGPPTGRRASARLRAG